MRRKTYNIYRLRLGSVGETEWEEGVKKMVAMSLIDTVGYNFASGWASCFEVIGDFEGYLVKCGIFE